MSGRPSPPPPRYGRREDAGSPYRGGAPNLYGLGPPTIVGPYGGGPGNMYDGPNGGYAPAPVPPHMRPTGISTPPPQIVHGDGPMPHSPWASLDKRQSRKIYTLPSYNSLNKKEAPLYEELINFPRAKDKEEMRCVMCGQAPGDLCVIPRQNKDVCKDCDKATWQHVQTQVYFKWCKGCKKFLRLASFSQKLDAAKCDKCRERGRQSYLLKKGKDGDEISLPRHHHHGHHHPHHIGGHHSPYSARHFQSPPPMPPMPHPMGLRPVRQTSYRELDEGRDYGIDDEDMSGEEEMHTTPERRHQRGQADTSVSSDNEEGGAGGVSNLGESEIDLDDDEMADATLSKMKLSTNFGVPLGRLQEGPTSRSTSEDSTHHNTTINSDSSSNHYHHHHHHHSPQHGGHHYTTTSPAMMPISSTFTSSSTAAPAVPIPQPTLPSTTSTTIAPPTASPTSASAAAAAAGGPNSLMELARIHQQIVDLEAQAEQVNVINSKLQQEQSRNRKLESTVQQLSMELDQVRQENVGLRMELDNWYAREEELLRRENSYGQYETVPLSTSSDAGDKRSRSESYSVATALAGIKKQKVGGGNRHGLSIATPHDLGEEEDLGKESFMSSFGGIDTPRTPAPLKEPTTGPVVAL